MTSVQQQSSPVLEDQATLIAGEIFNLINQYTNDSTVSKFFLTDEVAHASYVLAGGFASLVYTPALEPDELTDSSILSYIYALMTYGFNIFLKERSLLTNAAPYMLSTDTIFIKRVQKQVLRMTEQGKLLSTPLADKIVVIILRNVNHQMDMEELKMKGHKIQMKKFKDYSKLALYWGYNFALKLLENKTTKK